MALALPTTSCKVVVAVRNSCQGRLLAGNRVQIPHLVGIRHSTQRHWVLRRETKFQAVFTPLDDSASGPFHMGTILESGCYLVLVLPNAFFLREYQILQGHTVCWVHVWPDRPILMAQGIIEPRSRQKLYSFLLERCKSRYQKKTTLEIKGG